MAAEPTLIEFPADDPERARAFWSGLLGAALEPRRAGEGEGWQTRAGHADRDPAADAAAAPAVGAAPAVPAVGVHARGRGPGDTASLPYFSVADMAEALERVRALGGSIVHPGERWAICRDSEGSPFGLAARGA